MIIISQCNYVCKAPYTLNVVQCVCVCVCSFVYIHVCGMYISKERLDVFEAKTEESEKAGSIYRGL